MLPDLTAWLALGGRLDAAVLGAARDAEELKAQGNARFSAAEYEEARELYSRAITVFPQESCMAEQLVRRHRIGSAVRMCACAS
jgi:hypothetical protein